MRYVTMRTTSEPKLLHLGTKKALWFPQPVLPYDSVPWNFTSGQWPLIVYSTIIETCPFNEGSSHIKWKGTWKNVSITFYWLDDFKGQLPSIWKFMWHTLFDMHNLYFGPENLCDIHCFICIIYVLVWHIIDMPFQWSLITPDRYSQSHKVSRACTWHALFKTPRLYIFLHHQKLSNEAILHFNTSLYLSCSNSTKLITGTELRTGENSVPDEHDV